MSRRISLTVFQAVWFLINPNTMRRITKCHPEPSYLCWPHVCQADSISPSGETSSPNPHLQRCLHEEDDRWCCCGRRSFRWSDGSLRPSGPPVRPCRSPEERWGTNSTQEPRWRNPPSEAPESCCSYSTAARDDPVTDTARRRERAVASTRWKTIVLNASVLFLHQENTGKTIHALVNVLLQ